VSELTLRRRALFAAAHAYWLPGKTDAENRALFGRWASRWGHGHNYTLEACVTGTLDPVDGMVVNITEVDRILKSEILCALHEKHLTYEVPAFANTPPTLENLLTFIAARFEAAFTHPTARLSKVTLWELPTLWATWERTKKEDEMLTLTRKLDFAASHRLHAPGLTDSENLEVFGKCNNPRGHGHNYGVEVTVAGTPDPVTGMLVDLEKLDTVLETEIMTRFDHKSLNDDVPELTGLNPTSEQLTLTIWDILKEKIPAPARLHKVVVQETERNFFEYDGK
jgi:6-pyruvoyltetrahydropterin/6-carboxytetrahydropterin synthase